MIIRRKGSNLVAMMALAVLGSGSAPAWAQDVSAATTSSSSSSSSSTAVSASTSDALSPTSSGGLWTAPNYQVHPSERFKPKRLPADVAPRDLNATTTAAPTLGVTPTGTQAGITAVPADPNSSELRRDRRRTITQQTTPDFVYDVAAAKEFTKAVSSSPQYVWLSPDRPSPASQTQFKQNRLLATAEQLNKLDTYIKDLTQRIQNNLSVPGTAQLVETSNRKYNYLVSFVVKNNGQITNINNEDKAGTLTAVTLSDDTENSDVVQAINRALIKSSPVKVPPAGFAPWYMLMKYDVNTGKVLVACLNAK